MIFLFIGIAAAVFAADAAIKSRVEKSGSLPQSVWKGRILLQKYHNKGAMLNLGEKRQKLVAALSVLLTLFVLAVFVLSLGQRETICSGQAWRCFWAALLTIRMTG